MSVPTKIMHSTVAGNKPASLVSGQLAINEQDRILYYLDPNTGNPSSLLDQVGSFSPANNLAINGAMEIDQINRGTLVSAVNGYAIDMVKVTTSGVQVLSAQQVSDAPLGLVKCLKVAVTTANAAPGTSDNAFISFPIEGLRSQRLLFGTAAALNLAVGFWMKAFRAGTYGVNISNGANNRGYSTSIVYSTTNVWQWIYVSIPGDITGTWPVNNTKAVVVTLAMMAGASQQSTANTWGAGGQLGVTGQTNGVQSTSDFFEVTGLSVFPGYVDPSGVRAAGVQLPFSDMLQQCQRYWWKTFDHETAVGAATQTGCLEFSINVTTGYTDILPFRFAVPMVTAPAVTIYSANSGASGKVYDVGGALDIAATVVSVGQKGVNITAGPVSTNDDIRFHLTADARM